MLGLFRLAIRNALRHKLRTGLTVLGIIVATIAFGLLRTVVDAWYAGADATSATRLVTRNAISLVFDLPLSYRNKIRLAEGVESVSYANWFGGIYIDEKNFFPQFAIDAASYLDLYPEYILSEENKLAFMRDRQGAVAGRKLAEEYGWKVGDLIPIRGTIYAGNWSFVLRGIYHGADKKTDQTQFFFHWDNLNETLKKRQPSSADKVGVYIVRIHDPSRAAEISKEIDAVFANSLAETLTETEKAFQLGFVAMTEAIVIAIEIVSIVIIGIIMAVMANTMAMSARERMREYATMKALGFGPRHLLVLIFAESLTISISAALVGIVLIFPAADFFASKVGTLFPVFNVSEQTLWMAFAAATCVGVVAAVFPAWRAATGSIAKGLGSIG